MAFIQKTIYGHIKTELVRPGGISSYQWMAEAAGNVQIGV
jgi:hypothetical protein